MKTKEQIEEYLRLTKLDYADALKDSFRSNSLEKEVDASIKIRSLQLIINQLKWILED